MNKFYIIRLLLILFIPAIAYPALAGQSESVEVDTLRKPEDYSFLITGAAGFATTYHLRTEFSNAPAIGIGIEIPFDDYHLIGFEILTHTWIAEYTGEGTGNSYEYKNVFDDYYSQIGWTVGVKGYLTGNDNFFRVSYHLGYVLSPDRYYYALDSGIGLNFNISDNYYLSINRRFMLPVKFVDMKFYSPVPGFYLLNISRKIN